MTPDPEVGLTQADVSFLIGRRFHRTLFLNI